MLIIIARWVREKFYDFNKFISKFINFNIINKFLIINLINFK